MKQIQFIASFLLATTLAIPGTDAAAQWKVDDNWTQWGDKEGQVAFSEPTSSVTGIGKWIYLRVQWNTETGLCTSLVDLIDFADLKNGTPMSRYLIGKRFGENSYFYNTPIHVNGIDQEAYGVGKKESRYILLRAGSPDDDSGRYSRSKFATAFEKIPRLLGQASTLRIILLTREHGRLTYEFDMAGSRKAIQRVCPDLF